MDGWMDGWMDTSALDAYPAAPFRVPSAPGITIMEAYSIGLNDIGQSHRTLLFFFFKYLYL